MFARAVCLVNVHVAADAGVAETVRFSTRILSIGDRPRAGDTIVDGHGAVVLPGWSTRTITSSSITTVGSRGANATSTRRNGSTIFGRGYRAIRRSATAVRIRSASGCSSAR